MDAWFCDGVLDDEAVGRDEDGLALEEGEGGVSGVLGESEGVVCVSLEAVWTGAAWDWFTTGSKGLPEVISSGTEGGASAGEGCLPEELESGLGLLPPGADERILTNSGEEVEMVRDGRRVGASLEAAMRSIALEV